MRKLSLRLHTLFTMIPKGYDAIWDCCCDHGYLGMHILYARLSKIVYFVDQVESITQTLEKKLSYSQYDNYQVITDSAKNLSFNNTQKHLVIIAGVSGNTTIEIISAIENNHPNHTIDYLLSPNYHIEALKNKIATLHLSASNETIITDNKQTYHLFFLKK